MAVKRERIEAPPAWEILGAFFGYFAVAKDVPSVLRTLGLLRLCPAPWKVWLLQRAPADSWLLWGFTGFCVAALVTLLWRTRPLAEEETKNTIDTAVDHAFRKQTWLRAIRTLGLGPLRDAVVGAFGVAVYGTFQRPSDWPAAPDRFESIDRVTFKDGKGAEYQYALDHSKVILRETLPGGVKFGEPVERSATWADARLLLVASNFFARWVVVHLFKRPRPTVKKIPPG